jgi:hypothetical protein
MSTKKIPELQLTSFLGGLLKVLTLTGSSGYKTYAEVRENVESNFQGPYLSSGELLYSTIHDFRVEYCSYADAIGINYDANILTFHACKNLKSFNGICTDNLEKLIVTKCPNIKSVIDCDMPTTIKELFTDKPLNNILSLFKYPSITNLIVDNFARDFSGLNSSSIKPAYTIINNHLSSPVRDVFNCYEELIENGFREIAKL